MAAACTVVEALRAGLSAWHLPVTTTQAVRIAADINESINATPGYAGTYSGSASNESTTVLYSATVGVFEQRDDVTENKLGLVFAFCVDRS